MPIILGSEYKGVYNVGDTLLGEYLFTKQEFIVVGIMEENSYVNNGWGLKTLNRYILMPMFNCTYNSSTNEDYYFQIRHYINKTTGFLRIPSAASYQELKGVVGKLSQDSGLTGFTALSTDPVGSVQVGFMTINGKANALLIMVAALLLLIIFIILATVLQLKRIRINIQDYTACLISGMDYRLIYQSLIADLAFIVVLGNVAGILSSYILFKCFYYSMYAMALSIIFVFTAGAVFAIGFNKKSSETDDGGEQRCYVGLKTYVNPISKNEEKNWF